MVNPPDTRTFVFKFFDHEGGTPPDSDGVLDSTYVLYMFYFKNGLPPLLAGVCRPEKMSIGTSSAGPRATGAIVAAMKQCSPSAIESSTRTLRACRLVRHVGAFSQGASKDRGSRDGKRARTDPSVAS